MKQKQLIALNVMTPGSCIYANRDEWTLERVTTPRPSCIAAWKLRNQLRELPPGEKTTINGLEVRRRALTHQAAKYVINGDWYLIEGAIAVIEAAREQAA